MGAQRIVGHQLVGDLSRQRCCQPTLDIDRRQFLVLMLRLGIQLAPLARQVGMLRVGLGTDRHVLACRHRHRARHQPGHASY